MIGAPFVVRGTNWPAGQAVTITFARPQPGAQIQIDPSMSVANVGVSADGSFEATVAVPAGQGWEMEAEVLVVAYTADLSSSSVARYTILTQPVPTDTAAPTQEPGQPTPTATEIPTESPTEEGQPTQEPTAEPVVTTEPTVEPTVTTAPTTEPAPTAEPTAEPVATTEPTTEPVPTAEPTAEPMPTAEPTAEPTQVAPAQPILSLIPISGTVGITLTVHGEGWPSGAPVGFTLATPLVEGVVQLTVPVTDVVQVNEQGMFDTPVWFPEGLGLENAPQAWVIGRTQDGQIEVITTYTVVTMTLPVP